MIRLGAVVVTPEPSFFVGRGPSGAPASITKHRENVTERAAPFSRKRFAFGRYHPNEMQITRCLFALALSSAFVGCDAQDTIEQEEAFIDDADMEAPDDDTDAWVDSDGGPGAHAADIDGFNVDVDPAAVGFPTGSCRPGFGQAKPRLCVNSSTPANYGYASAQNYCRDRRSRVCTREDYSYIFGGPNPPSAYFNPKDYWLGNTVGDDQALCGNADVTWQWDNDRFNFDGTCSVTDKKRFRCCHDDEW